MSVSTTMTSERDFDNDAEDDDIDNYSFKSGNSAVIDIQKEMNLTVFDDMLAALINSRFVAPLVALYEENILMIINNFS